MNDRKVLFIWLKHRILIFCGIYVKYFMAAKTKLISIRIMASHNRKSQIFSAKIQ
jgi:hypothetical protein